MNVDRNGELPQGWTWATLHECVSILDKYRIPVNRKERESRIAGKSTDELYPYYGATGQVGLIDDYLFDEELLLLGEDGAPFFDPVKDVAYVINGKTWVNNHAHVLKACSEVSINRYVKHYLNRFDFHGYVTGTTRLKLTQGQLREIPLRLPPLPEQHRIVDKIEELFSDLDAGEAALEKTERLLERYRQSVLKAAVEGALTREWREQHPAGESADELLERILEERRARWEADQLAKYEAKGKNPPAGWKNRYKPPVGVEAEELPELPEGWRWASPEQLAAPEDYAVAIGPFGSNLKVSDYRDEGVPLVFVRNIRTGAYGGDLTRFVDHEKAEELRAHHVEPGDLLITKMGDPPGDADRYPTSEPTGVITADCIKWRLSSLLPEHNLFVFATNSDVVRSQIRGITKGVAQQKVSLRRFRTVAYPVPPVVEQEAIVEEVERLLSVVDAVAEEVTRQRARAKQLRRAILQHAFEGRLVPQDPEDEPAEVLLERIRAEKNGKAPAGKKRVRKGGWKAKEGVEEVKVKLDSSSASP